MLESRDQPLVFVQRPSDVRRYVVWWKELGLICDDVKRDLVTEMESAVTAVLKLSMPSVVNVKVASAFFDRKTFHQRIIHKFLVRRCETPIFPVSPIMTTGSRPLQQIRSIKKLEGGLLPSQLKFDEKVSFEYQCLK